jgi:sterol desaturase/sphingolipid hydroxylase (fatty acid hydroxylase superfamily)
MAIEALSPVIIIGSAVILIVLERLRPYDPDQALLREGFWTDLLWYAIAQSYLLALLIGALIRACMEIPAIRDLRVMQNVPLGWQVLFFLILHDVYIYFFHRLQHRSKHLWRIHEAHHSVKDVDWLAGARSHSLEILINQTIEFLPMALLGASPELPVIKGTIDAAWGMYIHSNIDVRSGWLQYVINGPEMHRWHHAREITDGGINFATKLGVWDWLFGTAYRPSSRPSGYGLTDVDFPSGVLSQHIFAFRRFATGSGKGDQP